MRLTALILSFTIHANYTHGQFEVMSSSVHYDGSQPKRRLCILFRLLAVRARDLHRGIWGGT
jgi:hypothetical protein